jgi:hypothetical protein
MLLSVCIVHPKVTKGSDKQISELRAVRFPRGESDFTENLAGQSLNGF